MANPSKLPNAYERMVAAEKEKQRLVPERLVTLIADKPWIKAVSQHAQARQALSGSRPVTPIVPRPFTDLDPSEFSPDDPGHLGPDVLEPIEPVSHCLESVEGGDVFLLQCLPGTSQQTQTIDWTWNGLILGHLAGLPAWQFKD
jgi:hypothetical protein